MFTFPTHQHTPPIEPDSPLPSPELFSSPPSENPFNFDLNNPPSQPSPSNTQDNIPNPPQKSPPIDPPIHRPRRLRNRPRFSYSDLTPDNFFDSNELSPKTQRKFLR